MNKYVWYAKPDIDFKKYGFIENESDYRFWQTNTTRICIEKRTHKVWFNNVFNDIVVKIAELLKDNAIYYEEKTKIKTYKIELTQSEWELILKRRTNNEL